jgi:hypothetical protein
MEEPHEVIKSKNFCLQISQHSQAYTYSPAEHLLKPITQEQHGSSVVALDFRKHVENCDWYQYHSVASPFKCCASVILGACGSVVG